MGKLHNDLRRKSKNEHFIRAFDYVAEQLDMTQGELAEAIGSKSAYISKHRNGIRPVPEETIEGLIRVSAGEPALQIFSEYLYGYSDIMLLANVTDEEMVASKLRHDNPDYDIMTQKEPATVPSPSGAGEAIPSWADSLIHLVSDNTSTLEEMRRENEQLRKELSQLRADLGAALQALRHHPVIYELPQESPTLPMAAEHQPSNNK